MKISPGLEATDNLELMAKPLIRYPDSRSLHPQDTFFRPGIFGFGNVFDRWPSTMVLLSRPFRAKSVQGICNPLIKPELKAQESTALNWKLRTTDSENGIDIVKP
ncbi:MAG: hypothetical protein ACXIUQ_11445 [Cecembia sp.]